jgi:hypothetical protein
LLLKPVHARVGVVVSVLAVAAACSTTDAAEPPPGLADRGTVLTTVSPTRQDLTNSVSLTGTVTMNPVFGLVAPVGGQMRYLDLKEPKSTPTKPTRFGSVWVDGRPNPVEVPAGATFAGRLVDDRASVTAGMPIASAKLAGYGIVAEIDSDKAYQIADGLTGVQAQIKNGPGPFPCAVLGTIAALPAGTVPAPPPVDEPPADPAGAAHGEIPKQPPVEEAPQENQPSGSDASGLRLVCTAPGDTKLINGASATLEIVTQTAANALVVPVEAVAGGQGNGKVEVVKDDGTKQVVDVVLGLTDGKVVEVRSGLTGEEKLSVPGPNLPPAPEGADPGGTGGK